MEATLTPALNALGHKDRAQQIAFVRLLHLAGAYGELPGVCGMLTDRQAEGVLTQVRFKDADAALDWLHAATQRHFIRRPPGAERCDAVEPDFACEHRDRIVPLLEVLGATQEKTPQRQCYDHVLVLGAMESAVDDRMRTFAKLWEQGLRCGKAYFLGSARPLDPAREMSMQEGCRTETEMMLARLRDHCELWPDDLKALPKAMVDTPLREGGARPNTRDTVQRWLECVQPEPGTVLVISNQPHAAYQLAAVESALPPGFQAEVAGSAMAPDAKIAVALDDMARQIDVGLAVLRERMHAELKRMEQMERLYLVDPMALKVDPARFQYRAAVDGSGVSDERRRDGPYVPLVHGDPLLLWQDKEGELFVVDGHHRTEFFQRLRAQGEGPARVPARILSEADGYTAEDAKIIGAYVNFMKKDGVNLAEAADVFHRVRHGRVHTDLLPPLPENDDLKLAQQAGGLHACAFDLVRSGAVPVPVAAAVAERTGDPVMQQQVMQAAARQLAANPDLREQIEDGCATETDTWRERVRQEARGEMQLGGRI